MPPRHAFVYLASQSPRRAQLLEQLGVRHQPLLPEADEDAEALEAERAGEDPAAYVQRVTLAKLQAALARLQRRALQTAAASPWAPVLCADTTVALGPRILAKPRDAADATTSLQVLSGRSHQVLTAVALAVPGQPPWTALSRSEVGVATLSPGLIAAYIASGEPFGKAGAYAIQGAFAACIERIEGSYSGIMGLPLFETAQLLRAAGVAAALPA